MKLFSPIIITIVTAAVIAGLVLAGSPKKERDRQLDDMRSGHLTSLRYAVITYWQTTRALPKTIEELAEGRAPVVLPYDPKTGAAYTYQPTGDMSFELCATFLTDTTDRQNQFGFAQPYGVGIVTDYMSHPAGYYCFSDKINEKEYPPFPLPASSTSTVTSS